MNSKQQQGHIQKSALADKKFNEIKITRKTSFLVPPSPDCEDAGEESSDYISDFPDFKKNTKAIIELKKRKISQGITSDSSDTFASVNSTSTTTTTTNLNSNMNYFYSNNIFILIFFHRKVYINVFRTNS